MPFCSGPSRPHSEDSPAGYTFYEITGVPPRCTGFNASDDAAWFSFFSYLNDWGGGGTNWTPGKEIIGKQNFLLATLICSAGSSCEGASVLNLREPLWLVTVNRCGCCQCSRCNIPQIGLEQGLGWGEVFCLWASMYKGKSNSNYTGEWWAWLHLYTEKKNWVKRLEGNMGTNLHRCREVGLLSSTKRTSSTQAPRCHQKCACIIPAYLWRVSLLTHWCIWLYKQYCIKQLLDFWM